MRVKTRRVGNSVTVTIPRDILAEMNIAEDTDMNIFVREGAVVLEPVASRWERVLEGVRAQAARAGVTEADVTEEMDQLRPRARTDSDDPQ